MAMAGGLRVAVGRSCRGVSSTGHDSRAALLY
nr:unnamed protein product [Digitaria exilis]